MKKVATFLTLVFALFLARTLPAVMTEKSGPDALSEGVKKLVPTGYVSLAHASSDLNGDDVDDVVIVLKRKGDEWLDKDHEKASPRPLLVLLGEKKKGVFRSALRNDDVAFTLEDGAASQDPLWDVTAKKGVFDLAFELGGGPTRYNVALSFRFSEKKRTWLLDRIVETSSDMNAPEGKDGEIVEKVETRTSKQFGEVALGDYHRAMFFDWAKKN